MRGHDVHGEEDHDDRNDYEEEAVKRMKMIMMMTELQNVKCSCR